MKPAISYSLAEAAFAVGVGQTKIEAAVTSGELSPRWIDSRKVILAADLLEWVASRPTEKVI